MSENNQSVDEQPSTASKSEQSGSGMSRSTGIAKPTGRRKVVSWAADTKENESTSPPVEDWRQRMGSATEQQAAIDAMFRKLDREAEARAKAALEQTAGEESSNTAEGA